MKKIIIIIEFLLVTLLVACDKDVSVSPPDPPLPTGKIFVSSFPEQALIFLNNKFTGNLTPDTIFYLESGTYSLTLRKKYFKDITTNVVISEDSLSDIFIDYRNYPGVLGNLGIDSSPRGAQIFINDSSTGKITPSTFSLFPGKYLIRLRFEGFWDAVREVEIESGKSIYPYIAMTDSLVWANFNPSNSGLPDFFINHTAIDNDNIKWIGTLSNGLVRFDDRTWTIYNSSNSLLPTDNIRFIGIDLENKKWICTQVGLVMFDDFNWVHYDIQNSGLPVDWISCIAFDKNGDKWIGTTEGVVKFDGNEWTVYNQENSPLESNFIESITIDNDGNKWIGISDQGLAKFDGSFWTIYNSVRFDFPNNVSSIAIDKNSVVWFTSVLKSMIPGGSAYSNDHYFWTIFTGTPSFDVRGVVVDDDNNKWFSNAESGMSKFDDISWSHFTTLNSKIPSDRITSIAIDLAGNKWISTYEGGLSKYKGE